MRNLFLQNNIFREFRQIHFIFWIRANYLVFFFRDESVPTNTMTGPLVSWGMLASL